MRPYLNLEFKFTTTIKVTNWYLATPGTLPKNKLMCLKMWGLRSQWNSAQLNNRYLKNNATNPAHLPQKWAKWAELAVQFSW